MNLEQRVITLEKEVADLKRQLEGQPDLEQFILKTFEENRDKIMVFR